MRPIADDLVAAPGEPELEGSRQDGVQQRRTACGGTGFSVDDAGACGRAVEAFLATPGPAILEALVDPFEPPLPGTITMDQATKFAQSLLRGEPNRGKIAWTVLGDRVREMV